MTDEILKDAELDEVVGGSGVQCMALMSRLQSEGLATFRTPLVAGNERAAAKELKAYLDGFKHSEGPNTVEFDVDIYADDRSNSYSVIAWRPGYGESHSISEDELVNLISKWQR